MKQKLSKQEQLHFAQQLLSLLQAGLALLSAIELIYQTAPKPWRLWLNTLHTQLKAGNSLSRCLHMQSHRFSAEFINLISVSERTGDIDLALAYLQLKTPVLRQAAFGDVEFAHDLDARDDHRVPVLGDGRHGIVEHAVDAVLDHHALDHGLDRLADLGRGVDQVGDVRGGRRRGGAGGQRGGSGWQRGR